MTTAKKKTEKTPHLHSRGRRVGIPKSEVRIAQKRPSSMYGTSDTTMECQERIYRGNSQQHSAKMLNIQAGALRNQAQSATMSDDLQVPRQARQTIHLRVYHLAREGYTKAIRHTGQEMPMRCEGNGWAIFRSICLGVGVVHVHARF